MDEKRIGHTFVTNNIIRESSRQTCRQEVLFYLRHPRDSEGARSSSGLRSDLNTEWIQAAAGKSFSKASFRRPLAILGSLMPAALTLAVFIEHGATRN